MRSIERGSTHPSRRRLRKHALINVGVQCSAACDIADSMFELLGGASEQLARGNTLPVAEFVRTLRGFWCLATRYAQISPQCAANAANAATGAVSVRRIRGPS